MIPYSQLKPGKQDYMMKTQKQLIMIQTTLYQHKT